MTLPATTCKSALQFRAVPSPGQEVRAERKARRWTQRRLAREADVDPSTVWRVENDIGENPTSLDQIHQALGMGEYAARVAAAPPASESTDTLTTAQLVSRIGLLTDELSRIQTELGAAQRRLAQQLGVGVHGPGPGVEWSDPEVSERERRQAEDI